MKDIGARGGRRAVGVLVRNVVPLAVLTVALFTTYNVWTRVRQNILNELTIEFNFRVVEENLRIYERLAASKQALRSVASLFTASGTVTRKQFRTFINQLQIEENYPGIQGIGFIALVPANLKEKHIESIHAEGLSDYAIQPAGKRDFYTPVVYFEPSSEPNRQVIGYDMQADPVFRQIMEEARDSGQVAVTPKMALKRSTDSEPHPGVFMFLPVYRDDSPLETPRARRTSIMGWVYAPLLIGELMHAIKGKRIGYLDIEIYDGDRISDAAKMFDLEPDISAANAMWQLRRVDRLTLGSHHWLVAANATPALGQYINDDRPTLILTSGVIISFLLALLARIFLDERAHTLQAAEQAMRLALYDPLTGLPNRKLIDERLAQGLAMAKRGGLQLALLFIDLDKFKPVNDEYGHAIGDLLLKEVAMRLQHFVRASDTVGRLGGDEFVALLLDIKGKQGAGVVAEKMLHALAQPFAISGNSLSIAASIGIAIFPDNALEQNSLLRSADKAMYEAKNSGRSTIRFA